MNLYGTCSSFRFTAHGDWTKNSPPTACKHSSTATLDNHPKKEDQQHRIEHPPFGRSQAYHREVQGAGRRSCFVPEQRKLQNTKEIGIQCGFSALDSSCCTATRTPRLCASSHGVPIETVSRLGHTNIKTTQIYTPVRPE